MAQDQKEQSDISLGRFEPGYVLHDRYEIEESLGSGGFAVVYAAFDRTIERKVAIKVLNVFAIAQSKDETDEILQRFLREARVAAKIRHPSIVEVYDFGVLDDGKRPYIIMEFLNGWDLKEEVEQQGPIDASRLLPLFCGVLEGLQEAHKQGVIHKDLKPANLLLSHPGSDDEILKVVDFGIAHVNAPGKERLTQTGVMSGTPEYLPPEYIEEQSVTEKMDIYQMGLSLVEGLSGEPVVSAPSPYEAAFKHVKRDLRIPAEFRSGAFGELLDRALALAPEDRFESALSFSKALADIDPDTVVLASMADTQRVPGPPSAAGLWADSGGGLAGEDSEVDEHASTNRIERKMVRIEADSKFIPPERDDAETAPDTTEEVAVGEEDGGTAEDDANEEGDDESIASATKADKQDEETPEESAHGEAEEREKESEPGEESSEPGEASEEGSEPGKASEEGSEPGEESKEASVHDAQPKQPALDVDAELLAQDTVELSSEKLSPQSTSTPDGSKIEEEPSQGRYSTNILLVAAVISVALVIVLSILAALLVLDEDALSGAGDEQPAVIDAPD